jgi:hypothetical protein
VREFSNVIVHCPGSDPRTDGPDVRIAIPGGRPVDPGIKIPCEALSKDADSRVASHLTFQIIVQIEGLSGAPEPGMKIPGLTWMLSPGGASIRETSTSAVITLFARSKTGSCTVSGSAVVDSVRVGMVLSP